MPRISDRHRATRRQQILDAAMSRFGGNGLHSTSMADIIAESGLSAGAVYLYFRSKEDLIGAVAEEVLGNVISLVDELQLAQTPVGPTGLVCALLERATSSEHPSPARSLPLLLAVWSESTRSQAVGDLGRRWLTVLRSRIEEVLQRWAHAGNVMPMPVEQLALVLMALVQGYVLQLAVGSAPSLTTYEAAVHALLEPTCAGPGCRSGERRSEPAVASSELGDDRGAGDGAVAS